MREVLERLAAANIQILPIPEISTHFVFERDGFICLVERRGGNSESPFGAMGAPGALTAAGLAPLIWRGSGAFFVAKDLEQAATPAQVEQLRSFTKDLEIALACSR